MVAEDQEQVDKILALKDQLPKLRLMLYDDPRGMVHYKADWVKSFAEVQALGRERAAREPAAFAAEVERGRPRGRGPDLLHVGHHRQPQGRHAHPRQRDRGRALVRERGEDRRLRRLSRLSPHGLGGGRALQHGAEPGRGLLHELPGEPGDGAARPARARAHRAPGAAAHLGEHAHGGAGSRRRRHPAEAGGLRLLPPGRGGGGDPPGRRQAAAARAPAQARARRVLRLPAGAGPARPAPLPLVPHRRRAARAGHLPVLPLHSG